MTKYKKASSLGKAGSIGFNQKEAKEIRKNFIPVTNLDHLALYLDGTKFSPESFDRFFDSNLRKKGAQAFNLKWIKNGGAKVDQLALSIQNDVQGYNVKDESEIIADIQYLVTTYPAGFTEYYFEASQHNEDEYNDNANYSDMENEIEREQANEAFEAGLKKSLKPKIRLKRTVKTVTKTLTKRKTVNKTKQAYTPELAILKRFFALHNKPVKITQLTSLQSGLKAAIATGKNHLQLIKTINAKLNVAIIKLQNANIGNIKKFEISKDLLAKVTAVVTAPQVKQVTLGGLKNHQKQYNKEVDAYKWYIINPIEKKALTGYEFKGDAIDALQDYDEYCKVVAKSSLKKLGIPDPSESWKHKDNKKTNLGTVEMNLQQYLNQENPIKEVRVILDEKDYKLGYLYKFSPYESRQQIFITNPQFVKEHGGIEYVLKNGGSTLYTTDGDGNAKRPSVFVINNKKTNLGAAKKSVKGNWTLADKKKLAKELGHEFYNSADWRKLTGKEKPSSKKKSSLGSFTSEHKEAIKEAANDVKTAGDLLAKAKKNKEAATKIAQLKKGLDKYTEIYLNLLAKTPKKQGLDRSQTSLFKNESKPQTSLFGDALHGIEQYTKKQAIALGIIDNSGNNLAGIEPKAKNPYDVINRIMIKQINKGVIPWEIPWSMDNGKAVKPMNFGSKREYRGVNFWSLISEMDLKGHEVPYFLTSKQIADKGGKIQTGAKPYYVTYYGKFITSETETNKETGQQETEEKLIKFLKLYAVYNIEDTDLKFEKPDNKPAPQVERIEAAEAILNNMPKKPTIKFGGNEAFYSPSKDLVQMPKIENFKIKDRYYSTFFHELVHSTKDNKRCGSDSFRKSSQKFADKQYSWEELVAELGACYLCGEAGILHKTVQHSAAYAKGWANSLVKFIGNDKTYFFKAANYAQKAADFILNKQVEKPNKTDKTKLNGIENFNTGDTVFILAGSPLRAIKATIKSIAKNGLNYNCLAVNGKIYTRQINEISKKYENITSLINSEKSLNGLGEILTKNDLSTIAKNAGASVKSPFQTMDKLVSGGTYQLEGERGKLLGNLGQVDCSITIRGDQGAGKSQLMWQLVDDFAEIGKNVAVVSPEMNGSSPTISKYRDKYIKPKNQNKVLFTDKKLTVKAIKDLSNAFDVVFVDSFNQLENYEQSQFDWLCKQLPNKCIVGLFQSTTGGEMRGGNKPEFDAYVNIEVVKVDDSFINNYAVCTKNRFGGTGAKYNVSTQKIMKESTNGLSGVAKKRAAKKAVKKVTKSVEASKVLKLMDDDYSYQDALKLVLSNNKNIDKTKLEKELNKYI
jgi:antirestriction protein ArdC